MPIDFTKGSCLAIIQDLTKGENSFISQLNLGKHEIMIISNENDCAKGTVYIYNSN